MKFLIRYLYVSLFIICVAGASCPPLDTTHTLWNDSACVDVQGAPLGTRCAPYCPAWRDDLVGPSQMVCATDGTWLPAPHAINQAPRCWRTPQIARQCFVKMKRALKVNRSAAVLFIIHASASLPETDLLTLKRFVRSILFTFPLSNMRVGGLITFSSAPRLVVALDEDSVCYYHRSVSMLTTEGTGANYFRALHHARQELLQKGLANTTVILFVSEAPDTGPALWQHIAADMKKSGAVIFTFGVGSSPSRDQLQLLASVDRNRSINSYWFRDFSKMADFSRYFRTHFKKILVFDCPLDFNLL